MFDSDWGVCQGHSQPEGHTYAQCYAPGYAQCMY